MASAFCCSTGSPRLLGQLMLATVATQAARNSRSGEGKVWVVAGAGGSSPIVGVGTLQA